MFATLSDRLADTFKNLRGKGRLSDADIDATAREIRIALLEADVALTVVRGFINRIKERARGEDVSRALNPAQQVIKIVNEELVGILGGETRRLVYAKQPPTVIMLAGLQGAGKTTLAGKLGMWLKKQRHAPLLVACDLQRPNAVTQLKVVGEQAGVEVFAPHPGATWDDEALAARAVDRLDHELVEPVEHLVEGARVLEPPGVDVRQQRLLAQVVADQLGQVRVDELVVGDAVAHGVRDGHGAEARRHQQAR